MWVHDRRVRGYGSSQHIVCVREVDDDDLVLLADFFAYADVMVAF